jgi:hypothetical protein
MASGTHDVDRPVNVRQETRNLKKGLISVVFFDRVFDTITFGMSDVTNGSASHERHAGRGCDDRETHQS